MISKIQLFRKYIEHKIPVFDKRQKNNWRYCNYSCGHCPIQAECKTMYNIPSITEKQKTRILHTNPELGI